MKKNLTKIATSVLLATGIGIVASSTSAKAISNSEAYFSKLEYKDATHDEERLLNKKASLTMQTTAEENGKVRSLSLVLFPKSQSIISLNRDGNSEVGLKLTRDGHAYAFVTQLNKYSNKTYTQIKKGSGHTFITPSGVKVRAGYTETNKLYFKWKDYKAVVYTDGSKKTYNDKVLSETKIRTFGKAKVVTPASDKKLTKGEKLIKEAKRLAGGRYVYNGQSLFYGLDCATYTQKIYMHVLNIDIGSTTKSQYARAKTRKAASKAKVGDVLYDGKGHVGIYAGNKKVYEMLIGGAKQYPYSHYNWKYALSF